MDFVGLTVNITDLSYLGVAEQKMHLWYQGIQESMHGLSLEVQKSLTVKCIQEFW